MPSSPKSPEVPRRIAPDAVEPVAKVERREAIGTANDAKKKALANIGAAR